MTFVASCFILRTIAIGQKLWLVKRSGLWLCSDGRTSDSGSVNNNVQTQAGKQRPNLDQNLCILLSFHKPIGLLRAPVQFAKDAAGSNRATRATYSFCSESLSRMQQKEIQGRDSYPEHV